MAQQGPPNESQHPSPINNDDPMMPSVQFIPNPQSVPMQVTFIPHVTTTTITTPPPTVTATPTDSIQASSSVAARMTVTQENPITSNMVGYASTTIETSGNTNAPMTTTAFQPSWGDAQNMTTPAPAPPTTTAATTSQISGSSTNTTTTTSSKSEDHSCAPPRHAPSTIASGDEDESTAHETSGKDPSFSVKLHRMLSLTENNDYITWLPHGRSWRVLEPQAFEMKTIPTYFRHAKVRFSRRCCCFCGFVFYVHPQELIL